MSFKDTPIRRKLMTSFLLVSGAVLLLTWTAFFVYEFVAVRQATVHHLSILGDIIANHATAALASGNQDGAKEVLAALKAERHIVAACLYDREGRQLSRYPSDLPAEALPATPETEGYRIGKAHLAAFHPVVQGGQRLGTLYLQSDRGAIQERLRPYAGIALAALLVSFLLAYTLSRVLQQQISRPILALSATARAISDRRDYSVRASKLGGGELGLLTEAFNQMLGQIQQQNRVLRESEARVRAVLNSALSAVVVIDPAGTITDWNEPAERMFGRTRGEAIGQNLAETIIPLRYREAHRRGIERFLATGEGPILNRLLQMSALRRDGSEFPVELAVSPLKTGDAVTFCGFITDVTERKRMEEAREQLAAIVESTDDAILTKTLDGVITSWNPGAEKCFGYTAQEVVGKPMLMLIPPERAHEEPEILARMVRGERIHHFETVRVGKGGKRIDLSVTISPLKNSQGEVIGVSKIAREITERKQAAASLEAQLSRFNLLHRITRAIGERQDLPSIFQVVIRSLEDNLRIDFGCICLYDHATELLTVISVGARSEALATELAMTEQAGIPIDPDGLARCVRGDLVYEPDLSQVQFPFPQRLARAGLRSLVAAPLLVESQVFGVLVAARHAAQGFSRGECEFLKQLSEHVALAAHQARLHGALQQAYDDLRQSQDTVMQQERLRALGQMASGIAHDINNAISPVALYTESLLEREPNLSDRARDYLATIQRAIEDVTETVARMREFYRQREPQLVLAPIDLNRMIRQVVDLTRARWCDLPQEHGIVIQLQTELEPNLPSIMGAQGEIRDALTNLVFNGVDAMPEGGTLTLRTRAIPAPESSQQGPSIGWVHLEICDTGVGMDGETKRRCLEPFFTTKGERGTGLGLAMVYGMVRRHSADIEIDSEPGQGTTVRLIFAVSAPVVTPTGRPSTPLIPARRLRILVIDDDPLLIKSLRDTLEADGHLVTATDGGQAGLDAFKSAQEGGDPFELVLTDLGMPYVDGRKVAATVKAASPTTPIVLLTGWGQRLKAENDMPPHVDRVLNKPPNLHDLRTALAELTASASGARKP